MNLIIHAPRFLVDTKEIDESHLTFLTTTRFLFGSHRWMEMPVKKTLVLLLCVVLGLELLSCTDQGEVQNAIAPPVQTITVKLKNTDMYQYPTVGGDEDGAIITNQARHFNLSEIRRDAATNFVAVYVYQPTAGYAGMDYAEIEIRSGSDGASAPRSIRIVGFNFIIYR